MCNRERTKQDVMQAQEAMLRLAERDHGLSARRLEMETGIPLSTIQSWRRGCAPSAITLHDFVALCRIIPDSLTSLCTEPAAKHVGSNGDGHDDLDVIAPLAADFAHGYGRARHPDSPGGTAIVPQEAADLHDIRRVLVAKAVAS